MKLIKSLNRFDLLASSARRSASTVAASHQSHSPSRISSHSSTHRGVGKSHHLSKSPFHVKYTYTLSSLLTQSYSYHTSIHTPSIPVQSTQSIHSTSPLQSDSHVFSSNGTHHQQDGSTNHQRFIVKVHSYYIAPHLNLQLLSKSTDIWSKQCIQPYSKPDCLLITFNQEAFNNIITQSQNQTTHEKKKVSSSASSLYDRLTQRQKSQPHNSSSNEKDLSPQITPPVQTATSTHTHVSSSSAAAAAAATVTPLSSTSSSSSLNPLLTFSPTDSYVVIFQYGSVVFFNASDLQQQYILRHIQSVMQISANSNTTPTASTATAAAASSKINTPSSTSKDDYRILVDPFSDELQGDSHHINGNGNNGSSNHSSHPSQHQHDDSPLYCNFDYNGMIVRSLDMNGLRVISQVLAQTVGLEYHEQKVDLLMSSFRRLNSNLATEGKLRILDHDLFKLVATNNGILADVLTELRLLDRSDLAWKYGELDEMLQGLRHEFEIKQRFESLEMKLTLMQQSTTFLLEVLHNKRSDKLEWIIIILIMVEVVISLVELPHILGISSIAEGPH